MWKCPKCKEESEDNFDSCSSCGTGRDGSPPTKFATCPHCGKDVAATDSACVHCGGTTKEDESIRPVYIMMNDVVGASLQKPAAPPPFYPPSGAPSCPQCASSEHLIKASAAYEQGTSAISGRGRQAGGVLPCRGWRRGYCANCYTHKFSRNTTDCFGRKAFAASNAEDIRRRDGNACNWGRHQCFHLNVYAEHGSEG